MQQLHNSPSTLPLSHCPDWAVFALGDRPVPRGTGPREQLLRSEALRQLLRVRGPVCPARDRSPRAELSRLCRFSLLFAGCAYGDRSIPAGTGPREQYLCANPLCSTQCLRKSVPHTRERSPRAKISQV
uniref:Uncharacterized protein n=1 Tax=Ananas comosus var. bracteatus TaxID=296719 RepID=A0A6V7Q2Y5_ANACO|nr:unnamed protein product [Ananas comosus var. bracteatus]